MRSSNQFDTVKSGGSALRRRPSAASFNANGLTNAKPLLLDVVPAVFFFSAICVWFPIKSLSYFLPWLAIFFLIAATRGGLSAKRLFGAIGGLSGLLIAWFVFDRGYYLLGGILSVFCYGGLIFFFTFSHRGFPVGQKTILKISRLWAWILAIEASIGVAEALYGYLRDRTFDVSNGDWVKGTIGITLHGLVKGGNFSNAMFAANIAFGLIMVVLLKGNRKLKIVAIAAGLMALVLASVMHVILFFLVSIIAAAFVVQAGKRYLNKWVVAVLLAAAVAAVFGSVVLSANMRLIAPYAVQFLQFKSPKGVMVKRITGPMLLDHPLLPVVGVGPGQLSSTGALIATGRYFGGPNGPKSVPFVPLHLTMLQKKYFYDQWLRQVDNRYFGSTQAPYFSILSIFAEYGGLIISLVLGAFFLVVWSARRAFLKRRISAEITFATVASATLMVLLGFQVNYWGVPQSTFLGFFNIVILSAYCKASSAGMEILPNGAPEK